MGEALGQADLWSDVNPPIGEALVRLTFLSDLLVRLTFGQMYPHDLKLPEGPIFFTYVFCCAFVGCAFQMIDYISFLSIWTLIFWLNK